MKIQVLLTAVALACAGSAIAQQAATTSDSAIARGYNVDGTKGKRATMNETAAVNGSATGTRADSGTKMSGGETIGEKTKRGLHKMGDAVKRAGHKVANAGRRATHNDRHADASDTRSMGASGNDSGRRSRMDSAYGNWQRKQKQ